MNKYAHLYNSFDLKQIFSQSQKILIFIRNGLSQEGNWKKTKRIGGGQSAGNPTEPIMYILISF